MRAGKSGIGAKNVLVRLLGAIEKFGIVIGLAEHEAGLGAGLAAIEEDGEELLAGFELAGADVGDAEEIEGGGIRVLIGGGLEKVESGLGLAAENQAGG